MKVSHLLVFDMYRLIANLKVKQKVSIHITDDRFSFTTKCHRSLRAVSDTAGLQAIAAFPSFGDNKVIPAWFITTKS